MNFLGSQGMQFFKFFSNSLLKGITLPIRKRRRLLSRRRQTGRDAF